MENIFYEDIIVIGLFQFSAALALGACVLGFGSSAAAQQPSRQTAASAVVAGPPIRIGMIEGLTGAFANTGEAVFRNLVWATERVNARGG
ncbi:MAG: branched-chain amino acid transport system substrate-binding protein, partial [Hydrogenophaga sp.]